MTTYFMTFGGTEKGKNRHNSSYGIHRDYKTEAERLFKSGVSVGFENFIYYDNAWIEKTEEYLSGNKVLRENSYGWAFKPMSIKHAMSNISDGDILLWLDSNHVFVKSPDRIVDFIKMNNVFTRDHHPTIYQNRCWTHKDMFKEMGCDEEKYWSAPQMQVNILGFIKNSFTVNLINEWNKYALEYNVMIANTLPNDPCFREHRHEQSIFSILREKYSLKYDHDPYDIVRELMGINVK